MKKSILLLVFLILLSAKSYSQSIGGGLLIGVPQDKFKELNNNTGFGFQIEGAILTPTPETPFTIGLTLGYQVLSTDNSTRRWSADIPDVTLNVDRSNNMVDGQLFFRLSPFFGTIRPYAEILAGGSYLFTQTSVKSNWDNKEIASNTNKSSFAWNYGAGGGILISLGSSFEGIEGLFIDLKVRYLKGLDAEYLTKEDVIIRNGEVFYNVRKSETSHINFGVGVVAYF